MEHDFGRQMYSVATNINGRVGANLVGLNFSSAFNQFIPLTQATSQIGTPNMTKATKDYMSSVIKDDGFANKSVFFN